MHMLFLLMALIFALSENVSYIESTKDIERVVCLSEISHENELTQKAPQIQIWALVPPHLHPRRCGLKC